MKNILIISLLILLIGCSKQDSDKHQLQASTSQKAEMKYGVNLGEFPDKKGNDYALEFDWQGELAEKYGRNFYKAHNICGNKYSYILDKATDTSTEEGSLTIHEFNKAYELCIRESLADQPIIPEKDRVKVIEVVNEISLNENTPDTFPEEVQSKNNISHKYIYDAGGWRYDDAKQKWVNARDDGRSDIAVIYRDGRVKPATTESESIQIRSRDEAPSIRNKDTNENLPYGYDEEHYGADVGMEIKSTASPKDRKIAKCLIYFERLHRKGTISKEDGAAGTLRCLSNGGVI